MTVGILRYDEERLVDELSKLTPAARTVFAAACAERILPAYGWFHERTGRGDPRALEGALDQVWATLQGGDPAGLRAQYDVAEALVPYEDDSWVDECAFAQHAAGAVAYAIGSALNGDAREAAWAARQVYEAIDLRVTSDDTVDMNAERAEEAIASDPRIQAELRRQQRDLDAVRRVGDGDIAAVATQLREVARCDGMALFRSM